MTFFFVILFSLVYVIEAIGLGGACVGGDCDAGLYCNQGGDDKCTACATCASHQHLSTVCDGTDNSAPTCENCVEISGCVSLQTTCDDGPSHTLNSLCTQCSDGNYGAYTSTCFSCASTSAAGDITYFDGTEWTILSKDEGKFLKSGASGVSWDTVGGGGLDAFNVFQIRDRYTFGDAPSESESIVKETLLSSTGAWKEMPNWEKGDLWYTGVPTMAPGKKLRARIYYRSTGLASTSNISYKVRVGTTETQLFHQTTPCPGIIKSTELVSAEDWTEAAGTKSIMIIARSDNGSGAGWIMVHGIMVWIA